MHRLGKNIEAVAVFIGSAESSLGAVPVLSFHKYKREG
jgi:hypothetical protein